jgi:cytochrome c biogenesis protein CcmG/thiol:disulfide interchange protein DsbE
MIRYLLPLVLFTVLAVFLYRGLDLNPRDLGSTRIDKPVPAFTLPDVLEPHRTISEKDFLGKVSLLNVWASWCTTCRYEHPLLMQLARQKFYIYGLNYKDKLADARATLTQSGNPYIANAFDEKGFVGIDWGVTGTPETFIIDQQGIVRYKHTGALTAELLQSQILPLIKKLQEQTN